MPRRPQGEAMRAVFLEYIREYNFWRYDIQLKCGTEQRAIEYYMSYDGTEVTPM